MINLKYKPTLEGEKVILRPFKTEDLGSIEECLKDPEVIKLTGSDSNYDEAVVTEWYNTRNLQEDRLDLAIEDKEKCVVVGEVVVNLYDEEKHSMNFRIMIGPRALFLRQDKERITICITNIMSTGVKRWIG